MWLGWQDLNLRMPESKSGALTTWRHPNIKMGGAGDENRTHDLQGHNLAL